MTALLALAVAWVLLSIPAAVCLARAVNRADREQAAEREAAKLRHPSGKAVA